jgi:hypothetical protein
MLSTVLKSPRAIAVNIEIMRAFVRLRETLAANKGLDQAVRRARSAHRPVPRQSGPGNRRDPSHYP